MKFYEFLNQGKELNIELVIGDVDMPASLCWNEGDIISEYGIEKYKEVMNGECEYFEETESTYPFVNVKCDDYKLGEKFAFDCAGYISEEEFNKIFISK